jgi:integrase
MTSCSPGPDGGLINPQRLTKWFTCHCRDAGLPTIWLHDVRHTYATAALASATGWHDVKVISKRLGHASVGIYSTPTPTSCR